MKTYIGCGKAVITVPDGTPLIGYEGEEPRVSSGVHDPLYAKAIVLEQQKKRYALVCCDLLAVDQKMVERLSQRSGTLGIGPSNFYMAATHTHSGPGGYFTIDEKEGGLSEFIFGQTDAKIVKTVEDAVFSAVQRATDDLEECVMSSLQAPVSGIGTDRNHPERPGDPVLTMLCFTTVSDRRILIYNMACHPTILNVKNTYVSADFPGETAAALEAEGICMALFLNGSAGDISTRFTRKASDFSETARIGRLLASQILEHMKNMPDRKSDIAMKSSVLNVPLRVRRVELSQQKEELSRLQDEFKAAGAQGMDPAKLRVLEARCEGAKMGVLYAQHQLSDDFLSVQVRFMQIGDIVFALYPVELFSTLSDPVRKAFDQKFVPVSYGGGYRGYLPDAGIADTDSYEKYVALFEFTEGERLMSEVVQHMEGIYDLR